MPTPPKKNHPWKQPSLISLRKKRWKPKTLNGPSQRYLAKFLVRDDPC